MPLERERVHKKKRVTGESRRFPVASEKSGIE